MNVELERKDDGGEMKMAWTDEWLPGEDVILCVCCYVSQLE